MWNLMSFKFMLHKFETPHCSKETDGFQIFFNAVYVANGCR